MKCSFTWGCSSRNCSTVLSLMGREVVENDVNFLLRSVLGDDLAQEGHEFLTGVTSCGFAMDPSRAGVQGRVQRERAMPVIFKAVALGAAGSGSTGSLRSNGLDGGLFIHTEDRWVLRRIEVQANNVGGLVFKVGVVAGHVANRWGFSPASFPASMHRVLTDPQMGGQSAATPGGGTIAGLLPGDRQNSRPQGSREELGSLSRVEGI